MKLLILFLITITTTTMYPHCGTCKSDMKEHKNKHKHPKNEQELLHELNLSDEQQDQYMKINTLFSKKLHDLSKEYRNKKNTLRVDYNNEIKLILTETQYEEYDRYLNNDHKH